MAATVKNVTPSYLTWVPMIEGNVASHVKCARVYFATYPATMFYYAMGIELM